MRRMEPAELLGVLPTCAFGRYAASKFAALLPPRVEEAVLGDGEHRKAVSTAPTTDVVLSGVPTLTEGRKATATHLIQVKKETMTNK
jgi:hypothetical protein